MREDVLVATQARAFPNVSQVAVAHALEASRRGAMRLPDGTIFGQVVELPESPFAIQVRDFREVKAELTPDGSVSVHRAPRKCYRVFVTKLAERRSPVIELFLDEFARPLFGWQPGEKIEGRG